VVVSRVLAHQIYILLVVEAAVYLGDVRMVQEGGDLDLVYQVLLHPQLPNLLLF
jgi:hypothetical protein